MSAGKTYWWAKDAAWLDREAVVELGVQFGPGGPLVRALVFLCGVALGLLSRPVLDAVSDEVRDVAAFYDREVERWLRAHSPQPHGGHDG